MALVSPLFLLGLVVLFYLLSFVLFAIIRIATGVSIQRVGYLSLRRISYTLKDGVRLDIRGLALRFHRPTFARPTWCSLRLTELKLTIDIKTVAEKDAKKQAHLDQEDESELAIQSPVGSPPASPQPGSPRRTSSVSSRSRTWRQLTQLKERIKALHGKINWLRMVDVEILNSGCEVVEVGNIHVGSLTMAIDTRRKTVDRGRLFRHKKLPEGEQRPAEWIFVVKGVLFTPHERESLEVIDICSLNIHGVLVKDLAGLRDTSISLKLGRIHIPYDDFIACDAKIQKFRHLYNQGSRTHKKSVSLSDMIEELDSPGSQEEKIVQTVSDSKEFIASILRGIQEIQMAVSFIGLTKEIRGVQPAGKPLYLHFSMNEFGIDLFRLDPRSPAHRMYFSSKDIAHQALLAAISIGVSIDDGDGRPERILYIPMATTTLKSTLPSKTITESVEADAAERNANILFANLVITSPSADLDLKHMPIVLALFQQRMSKPQNPSPDSHGQRLISRLLPKASVRISVQEPVIRVVLPTVSSGEQTAEEYDLLILSISSVSLELESSHSSEVDLHYTLTTNLRVSSQHLYYQTHSSDRHNLFINDALEFRIQIAAAPQVSVVASVNLETFSVHMTRSEISKGVRQITKQLRNHLRHRSQAKPSPKLSLLRRIPSWLSQAQFKGSNFQIEVAGVDSDVSPDLRGVAFQLESWNIDYKKQRNSSSRQRRDLHRALSNPLSDNEGIIKPLFSKPLDPDNPKSSDGRRVTVHVQGLQGFVIEGQNHWDSEPFLSMPRFEVAMSTSSDVHGRVFHINCHLKALYVHYSLYRYYAAGIAQTVLRRAFVGKHASSSEQVATATDEGSSAAEASSASMVEAVTIDIKANFLQVKASMPSNPAMMLRVYGAEFGHHRWASPFFKIRMLRLLADAPGIKSAWTTLANVKNGRVDLRESKRKVGSRYVSEKSIDISTEYMKLSVPHQLVLHKVLDNFVNTFKASEQLHHRFKTGTNEYVLNKEPEQPKKIPRVSLRSRNLFFVIEDSSFEWKLGLIYRIGLREQKQRMAREEAYKLKVKKLEEANRRGSSKNHPRAKSPKMRGRSKLTKSHTLAERDTSNEPGLHQESSRPDTRGRQMRYNTDAIGGLTGNAKISAQEAWNKLQAHNSSSWKRRITHAFKYQSNAVRDIRGILLNDDDSLDSFDDDDDEVILATPDRPGLMSTMINDLHIIVDKPSFPLSEFPRYLHDVGKGLPYDTQYSLLIPMNLQINMGESRVTLRNYPLPLIHVPALRAGQSARLPSWSVKTDFVIAEEYRDQQSIKRLKVEVVPSTKFFEHQNEKKGFFIDVRRTVSPVKTYSDVDISINTSNPTSITWGTSYQPAIQDMMQIIENFTKPQIDPSERIGFWDKIRLIFHSRVRVAWRGGGDVHLKLKGSRDPYVVTGFGAGFIMCFRNDVRWDIHQDDDPKQFMTVSCGEYVLAIPDYSRQARESSRDGNGRETESLLSESSSSRHNNAHFQKVIMKLSGNVRWMAGLVFERDVDDGSRSFESSPHYSVTLKTPEHAKSSSPRDVYDAFRGFRSHHIHLSIAVLAPVDRDWSVKNTKPSSSYNSIHMTPRFFTHFFDWWSLFSGVMALPIRQGQLFPGVEKSTKKFGRHLATIKYNLLLSPFFIAHIYKHKDIEEYAEETVGATGLKLRIDSFMLDLHQRREEFASQGSKKSKNLGEARTTGMKINKAQLDFISADLRAVSASIAGSTAEDIKRGTGESTVLRDSSYSSADFSKFTIPDNDFLWIDMDDFVELDWILPSETNPETKIMPLAFSPRFTYFRQTDHHGIISGDPTRTSNFGEEPTHICIMSHDNDPQRVQCDLIQDRILILNEQLEAQKRALGEHELRIIRNSYKDENGQEEFESLGYQITQLEAKRTFLQAMLDQLQTNLRLGRKPYAENQDDATSISDNADMKESAEAADLISDFNNRFTIHNIQLKWNNSLRNIILRYVHQVSQRRGFVYYMSRRAVKFILDIVEERQRGRASDPQSSLHTPTGQSSSSASFSRDDSDLDLEERIEELLKDGKSFVDADDPHQSSGPSGLDKTDIGENIAEEFTAQNSYHVSLIAPQIQLQSEKNPRSVLLVTGKRMELKVIQIMDKSRLADEISGLVQRRFSVEMDGVQFFVTNQKTLNKFIHLYTANKYGAPKGTAWPPWAPLEVNFDVHVNPFGWFRVVQETSAKLRYDKYNTLRLKYNDEVSKGDPNTSAAEDLERRIDHIWVDFPQLKAICDSAQYYSVYVIVLDLLMYNEPLEKSRSERLEKIMLAADFSDLTGAPEMVMSLQERIRQLEEIKGHFQLNAKHLDRQGWEDRISIEQDLASCEDELFFMMKAITTSQRRYDDRAQSQSTGVLSWHLTSSEIVWHLMREQNDPLMEIQLNNAIYDRTDNSDGSNRNTMEIERIHGLNLLPNALYPQMIEPYFEGQTISDEENIKMFKVQWYMLEAIAGIPVLDQFEINMFPLKIQLEREIGKKVFEYIFPANAEGTSASPFMVKHMAPIQDAVDDEPEQMSSLAPGMLNAPEQEPQPSTRPGSIELRLRPTLTLTDSSSRPNTSSSSRHKQPASPNAQSESHLMKFFSHKPRSSTQLPRASGAKGSSASLQSLHESHESLQFESRNQPMISSKSSRRSPSSTDDGDRPRKFGLSRTASKDSSGDRSKTNDDLTEMMSRASNYMTLAYVKIPSVVLCLSYKGRGDRNIEDVHNFVFRMPALEYRNKTWSNLDLALRLKKDVIKALISHTGAIIGNKFSHHRPNKMQQSRLRELANSSSLLPNSNSISHTITKKATTLYRRSASPEHSVKGSASDNGAPVERKESDASSLNDLRQPGGASTPSETSSVSSDADGSHLEIPSIRLQSDSNTSADQGDYPVNTIANGDSSQNGDSEERSRMSTMFNLRKKVLHKLN